MLLPPFLAVPAIRDPMDKETGILNQLQTSFTFIFQAQTH